MAAAVALVRGVKRKYLSKPDGALAPGKASRSEKKSKTDCIGKGKKQLPVPGGLRFGDFYRAENVRLRVPPEVVRLVGWSRTGKSIFMQSVPWKAGVTADGLMRVELDFDWLLHNHVAEPMHTRSDYAPQLHPALAAAVRTVACLGVVDIIHSYLYLPHFLYPPAAVLFDAHTMAIGTRHSRFTKLGNDPSSLHMTALCK